MDIAVKNKIRLRLATYNIHKCRGLDGRTDSGRIGSVLKPLKADVIALQEVIGPSLKSPGQEDVLATRMNMRPVLAPARSYRSHLYGNAVLSSLPVIKHESFDLSVEGYEPRLCQRVDVLVDNTAVHIYNVHFGTSSPERSRQAKKLLSFVMDTHVKGPKIVVGDFNEWKKSTASHLLSEKLHSMDLMPHLRWRKTYPGILPVLHIDHIYFTGHVELNSLQVSRRWPALIASDHLPIVAELVITVKESCHEQPANSGSHRKRNE
ncbi:MAG TPA: endonuclease/exonuclease/phosphatase family protein [Dissulfurispiraceae bacterium]|nr:endonuclease/exonuclease/phosphatase family protein [Dissulfurispiraceae bacterium]